MILNRSLSNSARAPGRDDVLSIRPGAGLFLAMAVVLLALAAPVHSGKLPLERLFAAPDLAGPALRNVKISPDGRLVAYVSDASGRSEVFLRAFPRSPESWQVSAAGGHSPVWSHDGKALIESARSLISKHTR